MCEQVTAILQQNQDQLWRLFNSEVNEMIVTKTGRKMFPKLQYIVKGLSSEKLYAVMLQIESVDGHRYKFSDGKWIESGKADSLETPQKSWHADGVRSGKDWMSSPICFDRVKITNKAGSTKPAILFLHSMHKYIPVLKIFESPSESPFSSHSSNQLIATVRLAHTEFIAVTAYQNGKITDLKIEHNAFAKGFREGKNSVNRKRRSPSVTDSASEDGTSPSPQPKILNNGSNHLLSTGTSIPNINPLFFNLPFLANLSSNFSSYPFQFPLGFPFLPPSSFPSSPSSNIMKETLENQPDLDVDVV